jgi:hypothetical protein
VDQKSIKKDWTKSHHLRVSITAAAAAKSSGMIKKPDAFVGPDVLYPVG